MAAAEQRERIEIDSEGAIVERALEGDADQAMRGDCLKGEHQVSVYIGIAELRVQRVDRVQVLPGVHELTLLDERDAAPNEDVRSEEIR